MPRPITRKDVARFRFEGRKVQKDKVLGYIMRVGPYWWSYRLDCGGTPMLVDESTIKRRQKIGHPPPRKSRKKRSQMPESDFSLEELALAETIMNGG